MGDTPPVETDVELEQQRMMNRVFNCPNLYSAAGPFTTVVQMVPVMVANHQTGGYFVVHLPVQPLPEHVVQPQHVFPLSPRTPPSPPRPPSRPPAPLSLLPPQTTDLSTGRTWRARPGAWWRWRTTSSWWRWWTTSSWTSAWTPPWS